MPNRKMSKRRYKNVPGTVVECKSGRFLAYYEHRTDIIANGNSEKEVKKNLKELYAVVIKHEQQEEENPPAGECHPTFKTKKFVEKSLS